MMERHRMTSEGDSASRILFFVNPLFQCDGPIPTCELWGDLGKHVSFRPRSLYTRPAPIKIHALRPSLVDRNLDFGFRVNALMFGHAHPYGVSTFPIDSSRLRPNRSIVIR